MMFWVRLPIFLLGVNLFLMKDIKIYLNRWLLLFFALLSFFACLYFANTSMLELQRLCYIPLVVAFVYFYSATKWFKNLFAWIGVSSYENYLMHWYIRKMLYDPQIRN